jgi:hypothetical protein
MPAELQAGARNEQPRSNIRRPPAPQTSRLCCLCRCGRDKEFSRRVARIQKHFLNTWRPRRDHGDMPLIPTKDALGYRCSQILIVSRYLQPALEVFSKDLQPRDRNERTVPRHARSTPKEILMGFSFRSRHCAPPHDTPQTSHSRLMRDTGWRKRCRFHRTPASLRPCDEIYSQILSRVSLSTAGCLGSHPWALKVTTFRIPRLVHKLSPRNACVVMLNGIVRGIVWMFISGCIRDTAHV